jgi:hypothetical protein
MMFRRGIDLLVPALYSTGTAIVLQSRSELIKKPPYN